jgi:hypothetical protein
MDNDAISGPGGCNYPCCFLGVGGGSWSAITVGLADTVTCGACRDGPRMAECRRARATQRLFELTRLSMEPAASMGSFLAGMDARVFAPASLGKPRTKTPVFWADNAIFCCSRSSAALSRGADATEDASIGPEDPLGFGLGLGLSESGAAAGMDAGRARACQQAPRIDRDVWEPGGAVRIRDSLGGAETFRRFRRRTKEERRAGLSDGGGRAGSEAIPPGLEPSGHEEPRRRKRRGRWGGSLDAITVGCG